MIAIHSELQTHLCFKDDAGNIEEPGPLSGANFGLTQHWVSTKYGAEIDFKGPLYSDICSC